MLLKHLALLAVCLAVTAATANAATMKQFKPGDLRACGAHRCVAIRSPRVLDARARFYYGRPIAPRLSAGRLPADILSRSH